MTPFTYRCTDCGREYFRDKVRYLCPECGKNYRPGIPLVGVLENGVRLQGHSFGVQARTARLESLLRGGTGIPSPHGRGEHTPSEGESVG